MIQVYATLLMKQNLKICCFKCRNYTADRDSQDFQKQKVEPRL